MTHGIDISERRLDDLDKEILRFALDYKAGDKVAIDIGSGFGRVSIMLALAGFDVWCFDIRDLSNHFAGIASALNIESKLHFVQKDITNLKSEDLPKRASIIIAQRVLHHLPFLKAKEVVQTLAHTLGREGKIFASFSGLRSPLGVDYEHATRQVRNRFCKVSTENQEHYNISGNVCLYEESDAERLFTNTDLIKERLYKSSFGNIKAIYKVRPQQNDNPIAKFFSSLINKICKRR